MIVYHATKSDFRQDVATGSIDQILLDRVHGVLGVGAAARLQRDGLRGRHRAASVRVGAQLSGPGGLEHEIYAPWLEQAPLFTKTDVARLRDFIKRWIRYGDRSEIILRIDGGRIRPSRSLADSLACLMKGNREFVMIDEQKLVYERAVHLGEPRGAFRALVIDEAHRLNEKSGLYQNLGDNQVKELIHSADVTIFFLDEDQRVTLQDIGTRDEIVRWAEYYHAHIEEMELLSQFRCNGSNGYLAWLDNAFGIRPTAHVDLSTLDYDYDFQVFDAPGEVRRLIEAKDEGANRSRMVAGYCWDWRSKKDPQAWDVVIPEHDFRMRWNLTQHGSGWLAHPESIREIGCIHTCQGLELDYVGVIIGDDLAVEHGRLVTRPEKRSKHDRSIRGWKKRMKLDRERTLADVRTIILNTYRTLMTRGLKGCYVYATDPGVRGWLRERGGATEPSKAVGLARQPRQVDPCLCRGRTPSFGCPFD